MKRRYNTNDDQGLRHYGHHDYGGGDKCIRHGADGEGEEIKGIRAYTALRFIWDFFACIRKRTERFCAG